MTPATPKATEREEAVLAAILIRKNIGQTDEKKRKQLAFKVDLIGSCKVVSVHNRSDEERSF
jgi:hypothetical protein